MVAGGGGPARRAPRPHFPSARAGATLGVRVPSPGRGRAPKSVPRRRQAPVVEDADLLRRIAALEESSVDRSHADQTTLQAMRKMDEDIHIIKQSVTALINAFGRLEEEKTAEMSSLKANAAATTDQLAQVRQEVAAMAKGLGELRAAHERSRAEAVELETSVRAAQERTDDLALQVADESRQRRADGEEFRGGLANVGRWPERVSVLQEDIARVEQALTDRAQLTAEAQDGLERSAAALRDQLGATRDYLAGVETEARQVTQELQRNNQTFMDRIENLQGQHMSLSQRVGVVADRLADAEDSWRAAHAGADAAGARAEEAVKASEACVLALDGVRATTDDLKASVHAVAGELHAEVLASAGRVQAANPAHASHVEMKALNERLHGAEARSTASVEAVGRLGATVQGLQEGCVVQRRYSCAHLWPKQVAPSPSRLRCQATPGR